MRRLGKLAVAATILAAFSGCGTSPCQELGERLCGCTGLSTDSCKKQVEEQLKELDLSDSTCDPYLASCNAPDGAQFCDWLLTASGERACGLAPPPAPTL